MKWDAVERVLTVAYEVAVILASPDQSMILYVAMSAADLLREVKAMPERERAKFLLAVLQLEEGPRRPKKKNRRVRWPDVEARAKRIFGGRVFPNLVLLERQEEEAF